MVALVAWQGAGDAVTGWFADQSALTTLVGLPLLAAATVALTGFAALRRATP